MTALEIKIAEKREEIISRCSKLNDEFLNHKKKLTECCGKDDTEAFARFVQSFIVNNYSNKNELFRIIKGEFDVLELIAKIDIERVLARKTCSACGNSNRVTTLKIKEQSSPIKNLIEMGVKAKDCILCAKKHIRYAIAIVPEILNGYDRDPVHVKLLEGNLIAAEQHIIMISAELASKIRVLRLDIFEIKKTLLTEHMASLIKIDDEILSLMKKQGMEEIILNKK